MRERSVGHMGRMGRLHTMICNARGCVSGYGIPPHHPPHVPPRERVNKEPKMSETKESGRRRAPRLPVGPAYEQTSREGVRYLVGRIGTLKQAGVPNDEIKEHRVWQLFATQGSHSTEHLVALAAGLPELEVR